VTTRRRTLRPPGRFLKYQVVPLKPEGILREDWRQIATEANCFTSEGDAITTARGLSLTQGGRPFAVVERETGAILHIARES